VNLYPVVPRETAITILLEGVWDMPSVWATGGVGPPAAAGAAPCGDH
jgi:hypothetical protein